MKKAIIIGATSGIGKELAVILGRNNYIVGLAGRRVELLLELQQELKNRSYIKQIDVSEPVPAMLLLQELIDEMGGMDLIVISAGQGYINPELEWQPEFETVKVNVLGFMAMANVAMQYFVQQGQGHIVGISSIAAIRGSASAPAYAASKAFVSNYLEGLRFQAQKSGMDIVVTDIQPGLVDTAMAQGDGLFWVAPVERAADQIFQVIRKRKKYAYVTKRWRMIAWLLRIIPDRFCHNL